VLAVIATGVEKLTCCQPEAVSPVNDGSSQQGTRAGPEVADVGTGVGTALVEAHTKDVAREIRGEFTPTLDREGSLKEGNAGTCCSPDRARTLPGAQRRGYSCGGNFEIAAVIY